MPKQKSNLPYKRTGAYRKILKKYKEEGVPTPKLLPEIINPNIQQTNAKFHPDPVPAEIVPEPSSEATMESDLGEESLDEGDEDEADYLEKCFHFKEKLRNWALEHKIPHTALNALMNIIKTTTEIGSLPKDSRTLLGRPRKIEVVPMGPESGLFWYQGLQKCFDSIASFIEPISYSEFHLSFNVDGLPIHKSSKYEFWPILAKIEEIPKLSPLILAIYFGKCKPDLKSFFQDFVEDVMTSIRNGIRVGDHLIKIKIRCFICDTPARAFIKGTVNFNHHQGCARCTVEGEFFKEGHHISFHRHNEATLRTDTSFRQRWVEDHHKETSPLETLPIDMVADFVVADPLHLLDLGIMKKCLTGWVHGSFNFKTKLRANAISEISNALLSFNKTLPTEIHRAVRGLDCLRFWKGLEYRTFMLYLGPVVLKDFLSPDVYLHFLKIFCAVTICSSNVYSKYLDIAKDLFSDYVEEFIDIYGKDSIGSNVHNLLHVVDDVKRFGPLGTISTYPFENKLFLIKSLLRGGKSPLQQVAMRLGEYSKLSCTSESKNLTYPCVSSCRNSFVDNNSFNQVTVREGLSLKSDKKNQWFLTKKKEIVSMEYGTCSDNEVFIYGKALKEKHPLFDENPLNSSYINIFRVNVELFNNSKLYHIEDIKCKLVSLDYQNSLIFFPLMHTLV